MYYIIFLLSICSPFFTRASLLSWVFSYDIINEVKLENTKNDDFGSYKLPWKKLRNNSEINGNEFVIKKLFERVGSFDECKSKITSSLTEELNGREINELNGDEYREIQTFLAMTLTACHYYEHNKEFSKVKPNQLSEDQFNIYTQFLIAVEDTIVNQLGHEKWERSVEILVSTLTLNLKFSNDKLDEIGETLQENSIKQREILTKQDTLIVNQDKTMKNQKIFQRKQNQSIKKQQKQHEIQRQTLLKQTEIKIGQQNIIDAHVKVVSIQNKTLVYQHMVTDSMQHFFKTIVKQNDNTLKETSEINGQIVSLVGTTKGLYENIDNLGEKQGEILKLQSKSHAIVSETAKRSNELTAMIRKQQAELTELQMKSEKLANIWGPTLEKLEKASQPYFVQLFYIAFYYALWLIVLRIIAHNYSVSWLIFISSIAIELYVDSVTKENKEKIRCYLMFFSILVRLIVFVGPIRFPKRLDLVSIAFLEINKGVVPNINPYDHPELLELLSLPPSGYEIGEDGELYSIE